MEENNPELNHENNCSKKAQKNTESKQRTMTGFKVTDDIVISGIAGRFPESDCMDEFADNLYNQIDMVTCDDRRWPADLNEGLISRCGKIKELDKFDGSFFNALPAVADAIDVQSRLLLETTYEAICDAGVNPQTMRGTKTGVYVGINTIACSDGIPQNDYHDCLKSDAWYFVYGSGKTLYANRISFLMNFNGPSYVMDTACSSSLVALVNALNDMRNGICDQAVVATANLSQAPITSFLYQATGLLSVDGKCKVWDKYADGFVRAETVGSLFLQKKSEAKRIYATILNARTNIDGFKSFGIFAPFWRTQRDLMVETLQEAGINPNDVKYIECHGTGTAVGDPQEVRSIADAYCSEQREEPLMVGSVKSNMGHSEGSSGMCGIAKAIITFENQCIPANLHFEEPNPELEAIVNKILIPVVNNTPFDHNIIGVNSFGIGGVNANVLLKANKKRTVEKINIIADIIPRLVNVCGRTEDAVNYIFDFIENNPNKANREFLALLTDVMKCITVKGSSNFPYRGYMIIKQNAVQYEYSRIITTSNDKQSVWLVFTGMGSQWTAMAKTLMPIKTFADSIKKSAKVLIPYNIDLMHILLSDNQNALNMKITNPFVALTSMQIALYDVIRLLNMKIDGIIGHSFGEIACAYVDGCLTQEQAVLTAYWRGKVVENANESGFLPKGMLAAVGLSWQQIKKRCPDGIVAACHNGSDSVTISGLYDNMVRFVEQLNTENIFARPIPGGQFPYHSNHMNIVAPQLLDALNSVIRKPKQRSDKWISTSVPPELWAHEKARYASGQYFTNNLISPVYFKEAIDKIENDSIVIEVAPHSFFEAIFKSCFPNLTYTCLMKRTESDNLNYILSSIGTLYTYGLNPDIENLYPRIEWPVSRGTQSISSLIKWDHERSNEVKKYPEYFNFNTASDFRMKFSLNDPDWSFLKDHAIDGRVIFPATGYLLMVWRRMSLLRGQPWKRTPIAFENVRFLRSTFLMGDQSIKFTVRLFEANGDFSITEGSSIVCTGKVFVPVIPVHETQDMRSERQTATNTTKKTDDTSCDHVILSSKDIYKELRVLGYDYGENFQGLVEARSDGQRGKAQWTGHVISFIDSIMHLAFFAQPMRTLFVPSGVQSVRIDSNTLFEAIESVVNTKQNEFCYPKESATHLNNKILVDESDVENGVSTLPVTFDVNTGSLMSTGIEISGLVAANVPRMAVHTGLVLEKYVFIANSEELVIDKALNDEVIEYIEVCCSLLQRLSNISLKTVFNCKCADERTVSKYFDSPKHNHKILKLLKLITRANVDNKCTSINEEKDIINSNNVISSYVDNNIDFDLLKTLLTTERLIFPVLQLILENISIRNTIKVLEINATKTIFAADIINFIKISRVGFSNIDYSLATQTPSAVNEDIKSLLNAKIFEWNISGLRMPDDVSSLDLLIYRPIIEISNHISIEDQMITIRDAVKDNGFILIMTRNMLTPPELAINELIHTNSNTEIMCYEELDKLVKVGEKYRLKLVAKKSDSFGSTLVLLRKLKSEITTPEIISIATAKYEQWVDVLKQKFIDNRNNKYKKNLWLVANDTPINGIIGLFNCLRLETGGDFIRCIFDCDNKLPLPMDFTKPPYNEVLELDLTINIYKNGEWGTFRHMGMSYERETVLTEHAYLNIAKRGDLSALKWFEVSHKHINSVLLNERNEQQVLCNVYYSAINFKDVVLATGRMQTLPEHALLDCLVGMEFTGRRSDNGKRVMAMVPIKGIATTILVDQVFLFEVPDQWTLEEAATVPVVYLTAYYALIMRANLVEGESVLIHSGAGGVGQAAINICQSLNCEIFVTVGNQHKREFIRNTFNIDDTHIGNSRDNSFEKLVMTVTKGKGVNVVLNSLTKDKLQASIRCLAQNGRFLEIGKYDMQTNSKLGLLDFLKNISFHGISIDFIFSEDTKSMKFQNCMRHLAKLLNDGIANNVVKPIVRTVFDMNECEHAFRYMTTGKHIGKVLIKVRDEETDENIVVNPLPLVVNATKKTWFHPTKVYVLIGGLGGFGLQLAYWMAMRGANKLVLTSRTGIKNAYQKFLLNKIKEIEIFLKNEIEVKVSSLNTSTIEGVNQLIDESNRMGSVGGVFNLAMVLRDGFIENQTVQTFTECCEPKLELLANLDLVTQNKCPQLDYFVCFSSHTAGRGNAGQTNYGYANSAMERICEVRRNKGLHGLAIQYGPIDDVGVIAEQLIHTVYRGDVFKLFGGVLLQRIHSCLDVVDRSLQSTLAIISSLEKASDVGSGQTTTDDILFQQLCVYLNIDKRSDNETLGDIGLESMIAVEIQQRLEKDYEISLSFAQIRKLTVKQFKGLKNSNKNIFMRL